MSRIPSVCGGGFDMTDMRDWLGHVGANWALEWARTDRSFADLTTQLVARIVERSPRKLMDIGCGAGELALAVSEKCPHASVVGIDLSPDLVAQARLRANTQPNCSFSVADASCWGDSAFAPDVLMSRHGVMFFEDPVAAFTNIAQASAPQAQLVFSCFRDRRLNAWATEIASLLPEASPPDKNAPGPFAFADPERVTALLTAAGWTDVQFAPVDWDYVAGAGPDPVADAVDFFTRIGPAAPVIAALAGAARTDFLGQLRLLAQSHLMDSVVAFNAAAWIVSAQLRR